MNNLKIIFMGSSDFAVKSLDNLLLNNYDIKAVVTAPDKKSGRGKKINFSDVKKYSLKKNLKFLLTRKSRFVKYLMKHKKLFMVLKV